MNRRLIAILALSASSQLLAQPIEFKGVKLGATREEFIKVHPQFECSTRAVYQPCPAYVSASVDGRTIDRPTYAGEEVASIVAAFSGDELASVHVRFEPRSYDAIAKAIAERYGKPTSSASEWVESAGGVKKLNVSAVWTRPDGRISISKFAGSLLQGVVSIQSAGDIAATAKATKEKASAAKKDL